MEGVNFLQSMLLFHSGSEVWKLSCGKPFFVAGVCVVPKAECVDASFGIQYKLLIIYSWAPNHVM